MRDYDYMNRARMFAEALADDSVWDWYEDLHDAYISGIQAAYAMNA